jgi:hypothetical protein
MLKFAYVSLMLRSFFNMPYIDYMGSTSLLPLRRKPCYGILWPWKIPPSSAGYKPAILGASGKHVIIETRSTTSVGLTLRSRKIWIYCCHLPPRSLPFLVFIRSATLAYFRVSILRNVVETNHLFPLTLHFWFYLHAFLLRLTFLTQENACSRGLKVLKPNYLTE